jgi:hypothetical protein
VKRRREQRGPTLGQKAKFVYRHRFLIVKRLEKLTRPDWAHLVQLFAYLPQLRLLWEFSQEVYALFNPEQLAKVARRRRTVLQRQGEYQQIPELEKALGLLAAEKFDHMVVFLESPVGQQVRTNNHVERTNRKIRFDEKVRYRWRSYRSLDRFLCLRLARLATLPARTQPPPPDDSRLQTGSAESLFRPAEVANPGGD